jgi:hypothetical protein
VKKPIPPELIVKAKAWLGKNGHEFFKEMKEKHGRVDAVYMEGRLPHPVHFREGMQVRNLMRESNLCEGWDDHDYDDSWVELIEMSLK